MFTKHKHVLFFLLILFCVNFALKLICIACPSLWYDEIISANDTFLEWGHIKHEAEWDKNPPFYHYILWIWCKFFGVSELALRSMSVFFSSLTALLIFILADKLSSRPFAYLAAIVFSVHPFLFYYAQEARCYAFLQFLIASNLLVVYHLYRQPTYLKAVFLGVLNFLIFYTHYIAGLALFCQFIFLAIHFRKRLLLLSLIYVTPVLLVLIRFTKKQYQVLFFSNEMSRQKSNVPLAGLEQLKQSIPPLLISWIAFVLFLLGVIYYLYRHSKRQSTEKDRTFKFFILFTPLFSIATLFLLGTLTNVYHERYLIFTVPFLVLSFFVFAEHKILLYSATVIVLAIEITGIRFGESRGQDYRFCAALTKEIEKKEDVNVIIQTHDVLSLFVYYYDKDAYLKKEWQNRELLKSKGIYCIDTYEDLRALSLDTSKPILLFQTFDRKEDNEKIRGFFVKNAYASVTNNTIPGAKFSFYKKLH